mgnify:CR=1 FL=1
MKTPIGAFAEGRPWRVFRADAFRLLERLPPRSVGLVFVDPPWATPDRAPIGRPNGAVALRADHVEYTKAIDFPRLIRLCARVLVEDGYALIWCGWHNISHVLDAANAPEAFGFGSNNVIARVVPNPAPRVRGLRKTDDGRKIGGGLISSWDCIAVLHRARTSTARCSLDGYHAHRNVREAPNPRSRRGQPKLHPASKPVRLSSELIEAFSLPGDVVLDPFCGGGNILVAAVACGRRVIGGDVDPAWARRAACAVRDAARIHATGNAA